MTQQAMQSLGESQLHPLDAGHFIWEDAADLYAALVTVWWAGGFTTCMAQPNDLITAHSIEEAQR